MKYEVTLVLPKNREILKDAYTEAMVNIANEILDVNELKLLIREMKDELKINKAE